VPALSGAAAQQRETQVRGSEVASDNYLRSVLRFLSDDLLLGRRAGTTGGHLAEGYLASQFEGLGLEGAGPDGTYAQPIELASVRSEATLVLGGQGQTLTFGPDDGGLVVWPTRPSANLTVDGPLVFAGFGIHAPEYEWDDFGEASLADRILVVLAGDPGTLDTGRFRGDRGTVHGTVERKAREAASRGARGILIVHDPAVTGTPWEATSAEWGGDVLLDPEATTSGALEFVGWVSGPRLAEMIGSFGRDLAVLRSRAAQPTFSPIPLGTHAVVRIRSTVESVRASGIGGWVRGADPRLQSDVVVVTAHYGHLGAMAGFGVDSIFNGARDNAAGVAIMLGAAEILRRSPDAPRRSILFVAPTGSEGTFPPGTALRRQVPVPSERVVAVINIERPSLSDDRPTVAAVDAADAGLLGALEAAATQEGLEITAADRFLPGGSELGHVVFAAEGVPGLTLIGAEAPNGPTDRYHTDRYHQPDDEFRDGGRYGGLRPQALLVARFARMIADAEDVAAWSAGSPYRPAWERLERRRGRRPTP
jgi:hypothetical protein